MNLRNPVPSGSSHWMNDELPSPPKLCRNNMKLMAPILQSLIRGSSLVTLLPLHIREGECETDLLSENQRAWKLSWFLTSQNSLNLKQSFCFLVVWDFFFPDLINVSQKKQFPTLGLDSHSSSECELKETKGLFCCFCWSHLPFDCLCISLKLTPSQDKEWDAYRQPKWKWVRAILWFFFPPFLFHLWSNSEPILSQKRHKRGNGWWRQYTVLQTDST